MSIQWIIGGIVAVLALGGIVMFSGTADKTAMTAETMQQEIPSPDAMQKDAQSEVMEKEVMQKEESLPKESIQKDAMMKSPDVGINEGGEMMKKESYTVYTPEKLAFAKEGKVVLFFRASWCPTCKALDADIRSHLSDIPADVMILDVNYDTAAALKQKYGVTYQHTLVQVDASGNQITKWSGGLTLADFLTHIK